MLRVPPPRVLLSRTHGYLGCGIIQDRLFSTITRAFMDMGCCRTTNREEILGETAEGIVYLCIRSFYPEHWRTFNNVNVFDMEFYVGYMTQVPQVIPPAPAFLSAATEVCTTEGRTVITHASFNHKKPVSIATLTHYLTDTVNNYLKTHRMVIIREPEPHRLMNRCWRAEEKPSNNYSVTYPFEIGSSDRISAVQLLASMLDEVHYATSHTTEHTYIQAIHDTVRFHHNIWRNFECGLIPDEDREDTEVDYHHTFGMIGLMFEKVEVSFAATYRLMYADYTPSSTYIQRGTRFAMVPLQNTVRRIVTQMISVTIRMSSYRIPKKWRDVYSHTWKGLAHTPLETFNSVDASVGLLNIIAQMDVSNAGLYLEYVIREDVGSKFWYEIVEWIYSKKEKLSERLKRNRKRSAFSTALHGIETCF